MRATRLLLAALAIGALAPAPAAAQSYPSRTVRIVVGTSPGAKEKFAFTPDILLVDYVFLAAPGRNLNGVRHRLGSLREVEG